MATNQPYTLQDVQDRINTLVNNDNDTPATTDDEWSVVLNLIYQAVGNWESQDVFWKELWKTYTHGATISAATSSYTISATDFKQPPGGYLRLILNGVTNYIPFISPQQYQTYAGEAKVAWVTGNNIDGWVLNLGWTPATGDGTVGATMKFDYYKMANRPTGVSEKFEMSDPNYIIYWVAAQKSLLESQNNKFSIYNTMAADTLDRMRVMNIVPSEFNDNSLDDTDSIAFGASMGE
jgi:hypothetical protein